MSETARITRDEAYVVRRYRERVSLCPRYRSADVERETQARPAASRFTGPEHLEARPAYLSHLGGEPRRDLQCRSASVHGQRGVIPQFQRAVEADEVCRGRYQGRL